MRFSVYAIFEDGGKQYKVTQGDKLLIETRELPEDQTELTFDKVLMVGGEDTPRIGQPYVDGATISAKVLEAMKLPKVRGIRFRRRKGLAKRWGHRQQALKVEISGINA